MEQQGNDSLFGVINKPPSFSGRKCDLEGFLTRAELAMESRPNQFHDDSAKVRFLMSYMLGKPLEWVSLLRKNNSPLLNNYDDFVKELKSNFGDYTTQAVVANSKLCSLRQRKSGFVFEYIAEFQRIAQYSDFNESAKIYMFIKGLKHSLREKLAIVDPNPRSLERLTTTILNIESLLKRNEKIEYYEQATPHDDPMEIDLYRIKRGPNDIKYRARTKNYTNNEKNYNEEKRKGICYYCKQSGHMSFNCDHVVVPQGIDAPGNIQQPSAGVERSVRPDRVPADGIVMLSDSRRHLFPGRRCENAPVVRAVNTSPIFREFVRCEHVRLITVGDPLSGSAPVHQTRERPRKVFLPVGDDPLKSPVIRIPRLRFQHRLPQPDQLFRLRFRDPAVRKDQQVDIAPARPEIIQYDAAVQPDAVNLSVQDGGNPFRHFPDYLIDLFQPGASFLDVIPQTPAGFPAAG